jgi:integrase/recombinase XerD
MKLTKRDLPSGAHYWQVDGRIRGARQRFKLPGSDGLGRREAEKLAAELWRAKELAAVGLAPECPRLTLGDLLAWDRERPDAARQTKKMLLARGKHLCRLLGDKTPVETLRGNDLDAYQRARVGEGVSARTINLELFHTLAPAINRAVTASLIADPGLSLRRLPEHRKRPRVLNKEELGALLGAIPASAIRNKTDAFDYIAFLAHTGLRRGEMMGSPDGVDQGIGWTAVDWIARTLTVRNAKRGGRAHTTERRLPLNAIALGILERRRATVENQDAPIFPWRARLKLWLPMAAKAAGLPRPEAISPHTLRHTFATLALQAGASIRDVAALIGDSVETTARVYLHESEEMMRRAVDSLASVDTQRARDK